MSYCSRCQQPVKSTAVNCPHCGILLKAHGHPGIPLHQAAGESYLCDTCKYHEDDTCTFPQRPYAKTCSLYHDKSIPLVESNTYKLSGGAAIKAWCRRNRGVLAVVALVAIALILAF